MAGYIGSKAIIVNSTSSNVTGDLTVDTNTLFVDSTNNRVGIGTSSPNSSSRLHVEGGAAEQVQIRVSQSDNTGVFMFSQSSSAGLWNADNTDTLFATNNTERLRIDSSGNVGIGYTTPSEKLGVNGFIGVVGTHTSPPSANPSISRVDQNNAMGFFNNSTERMRIDSSGNLLVGTTSTTPAVSNDSDGIALQSNGTVQFSANATTTAIINRKATDGAILQFRKDGTTVGSIGSVSYGMQIYATGVNNTGWTFGDGSAVLPMKNSALADNLVDLGSASYRMDDIYATNATIQTSDANEKQDIAELDEAEKRVAVSAKGLIRKYRWKDAVAEKGDDARIHVGIVAQDLQAAFAAEGLDAGRYAMFISSTWWEADEVIPAVEAVEAVDAIYEDVVIPAVLDEEGNEVEPERTEQRLVSEAIEAVEAQPERTVTHHYETAEEAPEGATERTRLGVRYPELLAFIIGAM